MANREEAGLLFNELSQETQLELYKNWQLNQDEAVSKLVEIAKDKGKVGYDAETVKRLIEDFIAEVEKHDESEDLELSAAELSAVSGGGGLGTKKISWTKKNISADLAAVMDDVRDGIRSIFGR